MLCLLIVVEQPTMYIFLFMKLEIYVCNVNSVFFDQNECVLLLFDCVLAGVGYSTYHNRPIRHVEKL